MKLLHPLDKSSTDSFAKVEKERARDLMSNSGENDGTNRGHSNPSDTNLPHWGMWKRNLHALCKQSKFWNTLVNALEVRFNLEEVVSLPQYMGLCPTGQCNAMCDFCSVTKNRSGIIKKQLPFEQVVEFINPISRTVRMYGLEGNGEPTLYDQFDELFSELTKGGACVYLITNGEKLENEQIHFMIQNRLDAVNFSLNAATSETHNEVMKLKQFPKVVSNIKEMVNYKKGHSIPIVAVSMVVTAQNIHEVREFLDFAENDLCVDRVYVRPLSEIANELGAVEDLRAIVPYECDVGDMIEEVQEYLADTPRRSQVSFAPETFRAWHPDPIDRVIQPKGFEDRLLPPRRGQWEVVLSSAAVSWNATKVKLRCPSVGHEEVLWESGYVPVELEKKLRFKCNTRMVKGELNLSLYDQRNQQIEKIVIPAHSTQEWVETEVWISTGDSSALKFVWSYAGSGCLVEIDFEKVRKPISILGKDFKLPSKDRWESCSAEAKIAWKENRLSLEWDGPSGPYILKSYSMPCQQEKEINMSVEIEVIKGVLGMGILSEDSQSWVKTFTFEPGMHQTPLQIQPGSNRQLQVVLYSIQQGELLATIDWGELLKTNEESNPIQNGEISRKETMQRIVRKLCNRAKDKIKQGWNPLELLPMAWKVAVTSILFGKRQYYCLKPWMDLNNFTVDGRMDVCCIATGPSQERYALGNILNQKFQEVWNGERIQEFRRTVNKPLKLPPCQRCPLALKPQGPFFFPEYNKESILLWITYWPLFCLVWLGFSSSWEKTCLKGCGHSSTFLKKRYFL